MTSLFTESQHRILKDIKLEFLKVNAAEDKMEPISDEAYTALIKEWNKPTKDELPEYEDHPSEYYDKLLNE